MSYTEIDRTSRFTALRPSDDLLDLVDECGAAPGVTPPIHAELPEMADEVYAGWVDDVIAVILDAATA